MEARRLETLAPVIDNAIPRLSRELFENPESSDI